MVFYRSEITPQKPLDFEVDISFANKDLSKAYPLLGIGKTHFEGSVSKSKGCLHLSGKLVAPLTLSDSHTLEAVPYDLDLDAECDILASEEEEGEGYIFPENRIELDELAYCLILTYMPRTYSKSKLEPVQGEGYSLSSEDDQAPSGNAFDALNPDDFA